MDQIANKDVKAQSDLILPNPLPISSLPSLTQEISGFFIVETHVLETTGTFRSERDVEELWDSIVMGLATAITNSLQKETDPDVFLRVKECLIGFIMTLEVPSLPLAPVLTCSPTSRRLHTPRRLCIPSFFFCLRNTSNFWKHSSAKDSNRYSIYR
jgi:hypothetical protein